MTYFILRMYRMTPIYSKIFYESAEKGKCAHGAIMSPAIYELAISNCIHTC